MSVADKITTLTNIRSDIRNALVGKGVSAAEHNFSNFANDINSISSGSGGEAVIEPIEITANGTYTASEGVDGYSPIAVNVTSGLAYDMGEFVLDADNVYANAVPHDLGSKPEFILVWTDDLAGTTNEYGNTTNVGFIWMKNLMGLKQRLTASSNTTGYTVNYYQSVGSNTLHTSAPTSAAYCHEDIDTDTTFVLHRQGSSVYWRAGITYKYFVSKAWWNTELGGATNA